MVLICFTAIDPHSHYRQHSCYAYTLDMCFEMLSGLTNHGWRLLTVNYGVMKDGDLTWVELPVEAFDGEPLQEPLKTLQREWEQILS